jgi:acyl-CoA synthetase (AMP-forming)/AMP-acid ligase II
MILPLPSTMPDRSLSIGSILDHAVRKHPRKGVVSRDGDGMVRITYAALAKRIARLANALRRLGVRPGDRVASFAWNGHRHLELYYAVPMMGAVLHTVNIRLFPGQVAELLEHADDRFVFFDVSLAGAVNAFRALQPGAQRTFVSMGATMQPIPDALDYEELLAAEDDVYDWPEVDERAGAILCYTSATTGDPKGVLFSHRSTYLHALVAGLPDFLGPKERDRILPIVPMFHVNAWGLPFIAPLAGSDLIMPMERLDPASVVALCRDECVTLSAGVPTVWMGVRDLLKERGERIPTLQRLVVGGSAMPRTLADDLEQLGIEAIHAWGMTEMSPLGTVTSNTSELDDDPALQQRERYKVGRFSPIVEWRLIDDRGEDVPADGVSRGELLVRGHAVTASYYHNEHATQAAFEPGGWFHTGDIVTIDAYGYLEIVDRVKDFIKSGGEWISSVELENVIMSHAGVREACAFGVPHPKWQERPVAAVVVREGHSLTEDALLAFLRERLSKWQIPDRIVFVDAIPRTGVGKFLKRELRATYGDLFTGEPAR